MFIRSKRQDKIKLIRLKCRVQKNGGERMEDMNIRNNKVALKALLMKNVKTDKEGRVLLARNDEWRKEKEWDELYNEIKQQ